MCVSGYPCYPTDSEEDEHSWNIFSESTIKGGGVEEGGHFGQERSEEGFGDSVWWSSKVEKEV